jgi:hypothetical protein
MNGHATIVIQLHAEVLADAVFLSIVGNEEPVLRVVPRNRKTTCVRDYQPVNAGGKIIGTSEVPRLSRFRPT